MIHIENDKTLIVKGNGAYLSIELAVIIKDLRDTFGDAFIDSALRLSKTRAIDKIRKEFVSRDLN